MNNKSTGELIVLEILSLLRPLMDAAEEMPIPSGIVALASDAGLNLEEILVEPNALESFATSFASSYRILIPIVESGRISDATELLDTMDSVRSLLVSIGDLNELDLRPGIQPDVKDVGTRILELLIIKYLRRYRRGIYYLLTLAGVIREGDIQSGQLHEIDFNYLSKLISNPCEIVTDIYSWGQVGFDPYSLLTRLQRVLLAIGIPALFHNPEPEAARSVGSDPDRDNPDQQLRLPVLTMEQEGRAGQVGVSLIPIPAVNVTEYRGLAVIPFGAGAVSESIALSDNWSFRINTSSDATVPYGVVVRPEGVDITRLDGSGTLPSLHVDLSIVRATRNGNRVVLLGAPDGARLEIGSIGLQVGLDYGASKEFFIAFPIQDARIVITTGDADGFLSKILPEDGITTEFDVTAGWSSLEGTYFSGSATFEVTIPIHKSLGPISIESIYFAIKVQEDGTIAIAVATSAGAAIGPVAASIQRIGVKTALSFPDNGGSLGPLNLEPPGFLPPKGAGLAIDAGAIAGGGFLEFDDPNKRYAGILQLQAGSIGLVAIGLISTRMPDGSEGFSLLINIGVEFMPPIQLPYGFTLSGVGGLLGYNRTMKTDVLRDGLRNRTLDSILFPEDPIANAPKIISDLRAVFPPEEGRFVIGPMVKLGWGTPVNIIQADIGIFIELPMPIRIALLGQIAAALPTPEKTIIELHIDILGVIEFDKQLLSIDATIYDSRIYEYTLTGDSALRLCWGDNPVFAMSLGGFHPRFSPPPNFPSLQRLTLNLSQGSDVQLYCRTYQALTSQSLQFGATVDLYAKQSRATVEGDLAFDTLIYFNPFSFTVTLGGNVVARYKGHELASVYLSLRLSGPTPWVANGKASFEILVWDVDVDFHKSWGPPQAITAEAEDPWPRLQEALASNNSWGSQLPGRNGMVEVLADIEDESDPKPLVLHPAGFLELRQSVVPLGIRLDKFGNAPVKDHNWFDIESMSIGGVELALNAVKEDFAQGQFVSLADPLAAPSFEKMKAGVAASSDRLSFKKEKVQSVKLTYESILIQEDRTSQIPKDEDKDKAKLEWGVGKRQMFGNAARSSGIRSTGRRKFENLGQAKQVGLVGDGYTLASNEDMSAVDIAGNDGSLGFLQAEQLLQNYVQDNPEMASVISVVPNFEVAA